MPKIPETFEFGRNEELSVDELLESLDEMYRILATAINQKPDVYFRELGGVGTDGNVNDVYINNGDININTDTNKVEMVTNHDSSATVVWTQLSP